MLAILTILGVLVAIAIAALLLVPVVLGVSGLAAILYMLAKLIIGFAVIFGPIVLIGVIIGKLI